MAKKITISTSFWMKKEEKKTKKKMNPLLLAWTKVVVKENWSNTIFFVLNVFSPTLRPIPNGT